MISFKELQADPKVRDIVRRKAASLARQRRSAVHGREDLEQELWLRLWRGLPRFDPELGTRIAWAATVVERAAASIHRDRQAGKRAGTPCSLDELCANGADDLPALAVADEHRREAELEQELGEFLSALPDDLRAFAAAFREGSLADTARRTGWSRSQLRLLAARLRAADGATELRRFLR